MLITAYPDIVRREGLAVEVVSGFASRSHGEFRRNPPAIVWHHDASPAGPSPGVLGWMINNWDQASANAWVDTNGKWWFVGAGVAWHAGAVLSGMPGNFEAMGIETDYTVGETISWKLYDSLRRGTAAIFRANRQSSSDLHFHKTICSPPGRKSDPWALDLATERSAVAKLIAGGNAPLPLPDPDTPGGPGGADPKDWLDIMTPDEVRQMIRDEVGNGLKALDPIIRETFNNAKWTNANLDKLMGPGSSPDSVGYKVWSQQVAEVENLPVWAILARAAAEKSEPPKD